MITIGDSEIVPDFSLQIISTYCQNDIPTLPTLSDNNVNGTWQPSVINPDNFNPQQFEFTPASGSCATTPTITITVNQIVTGIDFQTICQGDTLHWIDGNDYFSDNNTATWTIPNGAANGCDSIVMLNLTVNPTLYPGFDAIRTTYCQDDPNPDALFISTIVSGTWFPTDISTDIGDDQELYKYTVTSGQCATDTTIIVTINPTYTEFEALTISDNDLPYTYLDTIFQQGTQSSIIVITRQTVDGCDSIVTLDLTVITAGYFDEPETICEDLLPYPWRDTIFDIGTQSNDYVFYRTDIDGNDSIVTLHLTVTELTYGIDVIEICANNYTWIDGVTYTESNNTATHRIPNGTCDSIITLNLTLNIPVTPTFSFPYNYCVGATAQPLPNTDINGITGSWDDATAINTDIVATFTREFTPDQSFCAIPLIVTLNVIDNNIMSDFLLPTSYCFGDIPAPLSTISPEGVNGTWNYPDINTSTVTSTENPAITYEFTPVQGECAESYYQTITITAPTEIPSFNISTEYCHGDIIPDFPLESENNIFGTWSPEIDNTETTTYTFTPNAGQCADITTVEITIHPLGTSIEVGQDVNNLLSICNGISLEQPPYNAYTWSRDGVEITGMITEPGTYIVSTGTGSCSVETAIEVVLWFNNGLPVYSTSAINGSNDGVATLILDDYTGISILWSTGDTTATIYDLVPGTYYITITNGDCMMTDSVVVSGFIGLDDLSTPYINIYPNPATNVIYIDAQQNFDDIIIYDLTGSVVLRSSSNKEISISSLVSGVYFVNIRYDGKIISISKLLKQ
jgi:hypothetical protein